MNPTTPKTLTEKQQEIKDFFQEGLSHPETLYTKIIDLGSTLPPFPTDQLLERYRVPGCQSTLYLATTFSPENSILQFSATSDALISKGLAALLIWAYSGEKPETILRNPPKFLEEIGIPHLLSPSRANGLASIYAHMKKEAFFYFAQHLKSL